MNRKSFSSGVLVLILIVGITAGYVLGVLTTGGPIVLQAGDYKLLDEVKAVLQQRYYTTIPSDQELIYGAAKGLTAALGDPWTEYLTPDELTQLQGDLEGTYTGIGVAIGKVSDQIVIQAVFPNTPASRAGLKSGDVIVSVDGKSVGQVSVDVVSSMVMGKAGTTVTLDILRDGKTFPVQLKREEVSIPAVTDSKMVTPTVGYISLRQFYDNRASSEFKSALLQLKADGASSLIIDLRDNPGGMVEEARKIVGYFAPAQVVVYEKDKQDIKPLKAPGGSKLFTGSVAIWVNGGSASASEIVSGALRDLIGAKLIGEKTYGKGEIQSFEPLSEGALKVTIAEYLTPNKTTINKVGLTPDVNVTATNDAKLLQETLKVLK
ncbi:S41 family peptidase [Coprothermobacter platensis]|uniref:S41 family peptidase n=1 Tax=Coprothermobacter platensis TaxID=108819 RepID=UPI000376DE76|nr:S41 family peptidase [Coprothermobacter platensis]